MDSTAVAVMPAVDIQALVTNWQVVVAIVAMWVLGFVAKHGVGALDHKTWMWLIQGALGQVAAYLLDPGAFSFGDILGGLGLTGVVMGGHGMGKGALAAGKKVASKINGGGS